MISDLNGSLGSRQFFVADERTCFLHRARAHLKVPDCALLTKKLPMFLSQKHSASLGFILK